MGLDMPAISLSSDVCVITAAARYGVPADLMLAVRAVEAGEPGRAVVNADGSLDHNEPGINSRTIRELVYMGWDAKRLMNDGCYAMEAAALWMRNKLIAARQTQQPLLARAARYNSATPEYNIRYQARLMQPMRDWACHLHHFWKVQPQALFVIASNNMSTSELTACKPKRNP